MSRAAMGAVSVLIAILFWDPLDWLGPIYWEANRLQRKGQVTATAGQDAPATGALLDTFIELCNKSRYARSIERKPTGPIWVYGAGRNFSPNLGKDSYTILPQEARTLVCISDTTRDAEACGYWNPSGKATIGSWSIGRRVIDATVTLVDIQSSDKVGEVTLSGSLPSCPDQIRLSEYIGASLTGSRVDDTEIFSWVRKHWSP